MKTNIVLHQPLYPSNVGAVARAMGNMGADQLILIDPQCEINSQAQKAAVGCQKFLQERKVYQSWQEFYENEDEGLRVGWTARSGKLRLHREAEELFSELKEEKSPLLSNVYLFFGREDSGLSTDDVELCHHTCTIETFGDYSSLNLGQAVLLALYIVKNQLKETKIETKEAEPIAYPNDLVKNWLETLGFDLSAQRKNAHRVLNQIILRHRPEPKELKILEAVLQQNIRKLKEKNELQP